MSGGCWLTGGALSFLMTAPLCSTTHAVIILQAQARATRSPRRQVDRAFRRPNAISILTLVLARTTLNLFCGPASGSGRGVIRKGWQAYPLSPSSTPLNSPEHKKKIAMISITKCILKSITKNYMRCAFAIPCSNLWHSVDSLKIWESRADPDPLASTLVTMQRWSYYRPQDSYVFSPILNSCRNYNHQLTGLLVNPKQCSSAFSMSNVAPCHPTFF